MSRLALCLVIQEVGGGAVDPGWGVGGGAYPDQSLPGGGAHPWFPGHLGGRRDAGEWMSHTPGVPEKPQPPVPPDPSAPDQTLPSVPVDPAAPQPV